VNFIFSGGTEPPDGDLINVIKAEAARARL
jgi:hypothetical protein